MEVASNEVRNECGGVCLHPLPSVGAGKWPEKRRISKVRKYRFSEVLDGSRYSLGMGSCFAVSLVILGLSEHGSLETKLTINKRTT